ncbi:MAG: hypothetical protein PVF15_02845 [Candidatus Bathyarchaeota archaeon]
MKKSVFVMTALLACSMILNIPHAYAGTNSVTFITGDIDLVVFSARLEVGASAQTNVPAIFSGGSGDMKIGLSPENTSISVVFLGTTYTLNFTTPIGSVKIPITTIFGLGTIYARITGSVKTTLGVEGSGSVSPTSLSWTSEGSKSVSISHTGSMFSFDTIGITIPLSYVLSLAVGVEALGTTLYEYSEDVGTLSGTPVLTESISIFSIAVIAIVLIVVVVAIVGIAVVAKRRKKPV